MAGEGRVTRRNRAAPQRVRDALSETYGRVGTWRAVAAAWGISAALAWRVAVEGYWPRDAALRRQLLARAGVGLRRRDLFALPTAELRRRLENREEVRGGDEDETGTA